MTSVSRLDKYFKKGTRANLPKPTASNTDKQSYLTMIVHGDSTSVQELIVDIRSFPAKTARRVTSCTYIVER